MAKTIMTKREAKTQERHEKVLQAYRDYVKANPQASHHAICQAVAEDLDMSRPGVHFIIENAGLYTKKKDKQ